MSKNVLLNVIPTRAMLLKQNAQFKLVEFKEKKSLNKPSKLSEKEYLKRRKEELKLDSEDDEDSSDFDEEIFGDAKPKRQKREPQMDDGEFDMKRARHEIIKFGISGFGTKDKQKAKVELALKLGAKPKKNEYKNYKEILEEKKVAKAVEKEKSEFQQLGKNNIGVAVNSFHKANRKHLRRKRDDAGKGMLNHYGVVNPKIGKKSKK